MIISVSIEGKDVVLEDNVSGRIKLSSKLSREDFNVNVKPCASH